MSVMKSILVLSVLFTSTFSFSQDCFFLKENYTGICETLYPDGKVKIRARLENGIRNGDMELIYPHGLTRAIGSYKNDSLISSVCFHYHANTRLQWKVTFKEGEYYGIQYSSLGVIMNEGVLDEKMNAKGEWIIYDDKGEELKRILAEEQSIAVVFNRKPQISRFPDTRVADHK